MAAMEDTHQIDASVLVPVLNEEAHLRDAVEAMRAQEFDGTIEFLFMDGGSTDGSRAVLEELAREDARIRVFDNPGRKTPHALNVGLAAARGSYVVQMDAHTFYPQRYIAAGVERLERGDVDWVAGPAIPRGTGRWSKRVALALNSGLTTVGSRKWRAVRDGSGDEVELDTGVWAGVWRRETLDRFGGWDTGWPINQDSELAARVLADGGRIVMVPRMAARYFTRETLSALARQYGRYGYYRAKTACHHPESMRPSHILAPGVVVALPAAAIAPRPLRVAARMGLVAYAARLGAATARAARGADARDVAGLPVVWAVM